MFCTHSGHDACVKGLKFEFLP